jgi:hypothetical protein
LEEKVRRMDVDDMTSSSWWMLSSVGTRRMVSMAAKRLGEQVAVTPRKAGRAAALAARLAAAAAAAL